MSQAGFLKRMFYIFFAVFASLVLLGAISLFLDATSHGITQPSTKLRIEKGAVHIELTEMLPGLIMIILGATGFLLLVIKVPVKHIIETISKDAGKSFTSTTTKIPGKIPVLLYILFRKHLSLIRDHPHQDE